MPTVESADGTHIAYETTGTGPALVLVDGALCHRAGGPLRDLAALLRNDFTVYLYDRRGRGESGDTLPYAAAREIEDLQAVLAAAGGTAYVYGISSGAALALATTRRTPGITKLALYEPPFLADVEDGPRFAAYSARLRELLADGRRGDAVALFMTHVGMPEPVIAGLRRQPNWSAFEALAPTLAYDDAVLTGARLPRDGAVGVPVVVFAGGASPDGLQAAAKATAAALPGAAYRVLDKETHNVDPAALAPPLIEFLSGRKDV